MEITSIELKAVAHAIEDKTSMDTKELESLELMLVGGGMGDVVF